ncbi:MAG: hypothetical protein UY76_C0043G0003 [Candidatus Uhrbacteria bacterium GW2011_GWA2_52_8d]|uniref:Uncharacterized protein n=1 Tax=Candidatus Uhrbacteria bacterium GW2011_GWA2_52_8d TaxID=1618979 RepID=A0A0G1XLA8_9BACT|nr:MAG: hypothetical protein UY76_C0043G0003 [Candidatus Uhrbacteria bacterium GW2011_GWA2_52_8d]
MTREEIVTLIEQSQLDDQTKRHLFNLIIEKGMTAEVLDRIKETLDDTLIQTLKNAGLDITQTADFKAAENTFAQEAETAKEKFEAQMSELEQEIGDVEKQTSQQMDDLQTQAIKNSIT